LDDVSSNASFCVLDESVSLRSLSVSSRYADFAIASASREPSPPLVLNYATDHEHSELCKHVEDTIDSDTVKQERVKALVSITEKYRKHFADLIQWVNSGMSKAYSTELIKAIMASFCYDHEEVK
jgi:hypothetical protein